MKKFRQVIAYSLRTGRVRWVHDPEYPTTAQESRRLAQPRLGEGVILRTKLPPRQNGVSRNRLHEWQAAVCLASGRVPVDLHPTVRLVVEAAAKRAGRALIPIEDRYWTVWQDGRIELSHVDPAIPSDLVPDGRRYLAWGGAAAAKFLRREPAQVRAAVERFKARERAVA